MKELTKNNYQTTNGHFVIVILLLLISLSNIGCRQNEQCTPIAVYSGISWGYVDCKGNIIINPQFEYATNFDDEIAKVIINGKTGYINTSGKFVIEPKYKMGTNVSEGLVLVLDNKGATHCLDVNGNEIFSFNTPITVYPFNDGLAIYSYNPSYYGFIDKTGKIVIPAIYDSVENFSEGYAAVKSGDKYGYIDKSGRIVIPFQFVYASEFHEGAAAVFNGRFWGFIDKNGEYIINPQFEDTHPFSEGLACVLRNGQWGFIDKTGNFVISPQFEYARPFTEEYAAISQNGLYGFINKQGKVKIKPQFEGIGWFHNGLAGVCQNGKIGFINKKGKYVMQPQFDNSGTFVGRYTYGFYYGATDFAGVPNGASNNCVTSKYNESFDSYCPEKYMNLYIKFIIDSINPERFEPISPEDLDECGGWGFAFLDDDTIPEMYLHWCLHKDEIWINVLYIKDEKVHMNELHFYPRSYIPYKSLIYARFYDWDGENENENEYEYEYEDVHHYSNGTTDSALVMVKMIGDSIIGIEPSNSTNKKESNKEECKRLLAEKYFSRGAAKEFKRKPMRQLLYEINSRKK